MTYIATVGLTNDKTGKRFEAGEPVKDGDFTKKEIAHFLARGKLKEKEAADGSNSNDGKN